MSKIFELFGFRLDRWNEEAACNRAKAWCPFMDRICDGGGNRYLSALDIKKNPSLASYFPGLDVVQSGVCSLRLRETEQPWIVCPRRLLSLKGESPSSLQKHARQQVVRRASLRSGKVYRIWSEVKIKIDTSNVDDEMKSFDYTFDYVIAGVERRRLSEVASLLGLTEKKVREVAKNSGYTFAQRDGETWIDDFPADPVTIIEIMTSSTSGGDKNKRTQIAMACEDAVKDPSNHTGPGINYRQVWARMVSQLIVKSEVGIAWGGRTIWLIQDVLADYISKTTALDLNKYISEDPDEVNILAFGYGDLDDADSPPICPLSESTFYSGPISEGTTKGFVEIVKMGAAPDKSHVWRSLFSKAPCGSFVP